MTHVVLVHGAWQGSWCWERMLPLLERANVTWTAPTLSGCAERSAEMSPRLTLSDHIDEVARQIADADHDDVILVGHSYSGMVISGVAERISERLAGLVFVDAFYPSDGESALDQMPPPFQATFRQRAIDEGDGWRLPADSGLLDVWGVHDPELRGSIGPRLTDWSLNCFTSPLEAPQMRRSELRRMYVAADADAYPAKAAFGPIAAKAAADGCELHGVDSGHDVMLEQPEKLTQILLAMTG